MQRGVRPGFLVPVLLLLSAGAAEGQRLGARARGATQDTITEIGRLRMRLDSLERRVEELEKGDVEDAREESTDDGRTAQLERRLTQIERQNATLERELASLSTGGGRTANAGQVVRAPFTVLGPSGEVYFQVAPAPDGLARAVVGDPSGASVHIGPDPDGVASVRVYSSAKGSHASIMATPQSSYLIVEQDTKSGTLAVNRTEGGLLHLINAGGVPAVTLKYSQRGVGYLALTDAEGNIRVEAGTNTESIGQVRVTGPGGGGMSTAPGMPPSFIRGWK